MPLIEETLTTAPRRSIRCGSAWRVMRNAPVRLVRSVDSQLSSVSSRSAAESPTPALFTSTSTPPKRSAAASTAAALCSGSPTSAAAVVAWCYDRGVTIVPRGGGTGYAGGSVPIEGGVVVSLERLDRVRRFDPLLWRIQVEAGVTTARLRRLARESGLYFPPDPGAAEQSQVGGHIATNARGPAAFKYGVAGAWVTGLAGVVAPGGLGACW